MSLTEREQKLRRNICIDCNEFSGEHFVSIQL